MLLRHKKTQGEDQNWCVILSPIPSEIDRKKVAQKITSVFNLSSDEALDLVSNTPIIILDNLTRSIAAKVKDFFRIAGAETILTNDIFQKRKCYRTVWPEPPNLSFLQDWNAIAPGEEEQQELHPKDALNEIRAIDSEEKRSAHQPSLTSIPFMQRTEREQLAEEADRWRRECVKLREELKSLREQLERKQKESLLGFSSNDDNDWLEEKEKEIKEAQLLLEHANEKHETLRQEYANARHLYEEKIAELVQEGEQARRKAYELHEAQKTFERDKQMFLSQIQEKDAEIQRFASLNQENDQNKRKASEIAESLRGLQREKSTLEERLAQKERDIQILNDENRKNRSTSDQKTAKFLEEIAKLEFQVKESQEKTQLFQRAKEELELTVNTQSEQIVHWRDRHDQQMPKITLLEQEIHNEKTLREALEIRQRELEKNQNRLLHELEEKNRSIQDWEGKFLTLDRQWNQLKEAYENQEKMLQHQTKQLDARERELDAARRQVREINVQIEHRETIQKRTLLASQLVEKEIILKKLVQDQEKVEAEIKAREESMRALLMQQETVEKEIIEAKQAQRHLAELAKREQQKGRKLGVHQDGSSPEDTQND